MTCLLLTACGQRSLSGQTERQLASKEVAVTSNDEPTMDAELRELYDFLLAEGCKRFYIEGVGGLQSDDVEVLSFTNGVWEVCYMERGLKQPPLFSSADKAEAIAYYKQHVLSMTHIHLVVMTRSLEVFNRYSSKIKNLNIATYQNDIPNYSNANDVVYRLFVYGKDIFKVKEWDETLPFVDEELK